MPRNIEQFFHGEHQGTPEVVPVEEVRAYVEVNSIPAASGRKCVDGRYSPSQGPGMIARPGGDFGYVMALMRVNRERDLGLVPEECFGKVFDAVTSENGAFYMHTDHHADPIEDVGHGHGDAPYIGCGHIGKALAVENEDLFGIGCKNLRTLVDNSRHIAEAEGSVEIVNLEGEHEEKGVLVIDGLDRTLLPSNGQEMYFLYDKARDEAFMADLVEKMGIQGLVYEDLLQASNKQLQAVLALLAKGMPIYTVDFTGEKAQVGQAGFVS